MYKEIVHICMYSVRRCILLNFIILFSQVLKPSFAYVLTRNKKLTRIVSQRIEQVSLTETDKVNFISGW